MIKLNRNWLFFPVAAIGVLILFAAIKSRPDIPIKPALSRARPVDVVKLEQKLFAPQVTGFGRVVPKRSWQAIAEVKGKVIYRHPLLERGQIVPANTLLLTIDPTDYQIAVAKAKADINAIEAKLTKLSLDKKSLATNLSIEKRRLILGEKELARQRNLKAKGLVSQSALDDEQQAYYTLQNQVHDLESKLKVLPTELKITQAEHEAAKLVLAQAERDLARTEIRLPFTSRIADINIEQDQVVTDNLIMFEAHSFDIIEVEAQVSIHDMQLILADDLTELEAKVMLSSGSFSQSWPAQVVRLSDRVDYEQATFGVILEVSLFEPSASTSLAAPALVNGMFVKVEIMGKPKLHFVVPEKVLRGERLYLFKANKLAIVPITVLFRRNEQVAVASNNSDLNAASLLVTNDLIPALEGMALQIVAENNDSMEVTP